MATEKEKNNAGASTNEAGNPSANETGNPNHPTKAQLDKWKQQHKELFVIEMEGSSGKLQAILKKPDMNIMSSGLKKYKDDPMGFSRHIFNNCKLFVDAEILSDDDNMMAALSELSEVIKTKEATIKKI